MFACIKGKIEINIFEKHSSRSMVNIVMRDVFLLFLDSLTFHEMKAIKRYRTNYLSYEWKSKQIAQYTNSVASTDAAAQDGTPLATVDDFLAVR